MLVCNKCGSTDVDAQAWVNINTLEYQDWCDDETDFCNRCNDFVKVREETDTEKQEQIEAINYLNKVNSKLKF